MTSKRRNHSPEFKAKFALAAAKGDKTLSELTRQFCLHANQITTRKQESLKYTSSIFDEKSP